MDRNLLDAILPALNAAVANARIGKIHQPTDDTLIFRLWNGRENLRLLISTGPYARLHLTEKDYPNPFTPPRFCQLLRARITRIESLRQVNDDRIVRFDCRGPEGGCHLYVELFGRPGNAILVDAGGRIIDALVRRRAGDGERELLPGRPYVLPATQKSGPKKPGEVPLDEAVDIRQLSRQLDEEYYPKQFRSGQLGDRGALQQVLNRERKRLQRRLENIRREGEQKTDFNTGRHLGELLLANLHRVKKGMTDVEVDDYTSQPPNRVVIPLDPRLSPQENAEALFKRYKKDKRGLDHVARRQRETEEELAWVEQLRHDLDQAETPEELRELAAELRQAGLYRPARIEPATRRRLDNPPAVRRTRSPGGFEVLWGRNNRANDHLSHRLAAGHDYWFHAMDSPGAHVVLRRDSDRITVPEADLAFAAAIAAAQSRRKNDAAVEVMCALVRDLIRPKWGHPGQVLVPRFETVRVAPALPETDDGEDG
ncbi:MAG: hypothetical protein Tsb0017_00010 [Geothermobacteraceae bacterium]